MFLSSQTSTPTHLKKINSIFNQEKNLSLIEASCLLPPPETEVESIIKREEFTFPEEKIEVSETRYTTAAKQRVKKTRICLIGKLFSLCFFVTYPVVVWILFCFFFFFLFCIYLFIRSTVFYEHILCRSSVVFSRFPPDERACSGLKWTLYDVQISVLTSEHYKTTFKRLFHSEQIYRRFAVLIVFPPTEIRFTLS